MTAFLLWSACFIIWTTSLLNIAQSNKFETDGLNYWASLDSFVPIRNATYGTIQIKSKMFLQWKLHWYGSSHLPSYRSILRIGDTNTNPSCDGYPGGYPAIYANSRSGALQITISDTVDCRGLHYQSIDYKLSTNTEYNFLLQITDSAVALFVNGESIYSGTRPGPTHNDTLGSLANIMISDGLYLAANCTINDLLILSYDTVKTLYPTHSPTNAPSSAPTIYVSSSPTVQPTPMAVDTPLPTLVTMQPSSPPTVSLMTDAPTEQTPIPTLQPSLEPTYIPSAVPSLEPTLEPSQSITETDEPAIIQVFLVQIRTVSTRMMRFMTNVIKFVINS